MNHQIPIEDGCVVRVEKGDQKINFILSFMGEELATVSFPEVAINRVAKKKALPEGVYSEENSDIYILIERPASVIRFSDAIAKAVDTEQLLAVLKEI